MTKMPSIEKIILEYTHSEDFSEVENMDWSTHEMLDIIELFTSGLFLWFGDYLIEEGERLKRTTNEAVKTVKEKWANGYKNND